MSTGEQPGSLVNSMSLAGLHMPMVAPGAGMPKAPGQTHMGFWAEAAGTVPFPTRAAAILMGKMHS